MTLPLKADIDDLRALGRELRHLGHAATLLSWDQETQMPRGGVAARAGALAHLRTEIHARFASARLAGLIERLEGRLEPGSLEQTVLERCSREHTLALKLRPELVERRSRVSTEARPLWRKARSERDWSLFAPTMRRVLNVCIETAEAIGYDGERYDAMLELHEPGLTTLQLEQLLGAMRDVARPLLERIDPPNQEEDALLGAPWDTQAQLAFATYLAEAVGFDLTRGRIDVSAHPIANAIGAGDIRITTSIRAEQPLRAIFGALHEAGHALYAQGLPDRLSESPLWGAPSLALDESQSRLWENHVGRSLPFWRRHLPELRRRFPQSSDALDLDRFYALINRPSRSPIRLDTDELTHNLHVFVRFELERELLERRLDVADVPAAFAERTRNELGIELRDDSEGPLQDIHWAGCYIGTFTCYALGDLIAAQLIERVRASLPDLDAQLDAGDASGLLRWLREHVHAHGASLTTPELVRRVTGEGISARAWIAAMEQRLAPLATPARGVRTG